MELGTEWTTCLDLDSLSSGFGVKVTAPLFHDTLTQTAQSIPGRSSLWSMELRASGEHYRKLVAQWSLLFRKDNQRHGNSYRNPWHPWHTCPLMWILFHISDNTFRDVSELLTPKLRLPSVIAGTMTISALWHFISMCLKAVEKDDVTWPVQALNCLDLSNLSLTSIANPPLHIREDVSTSTTITAAGLHDFNLK